MNKDISIPVLICIVSIGAFSWVALTISTVWIFVLAVVVTYFLYINTLYREMPEPERILPIYLFALGIQMLHFAEEYLTDFVIELPAILGQEPYPLDYWLSFNMVAYFIFLLGGIVLFKKLRAYAVIPLFFILVGVLFNSVAHLGLAIYSGGYFSGLFTALIYFLIAPTLIKRTFKIQE